MERRRLCAFVAGPLAIGFLLVLAGLAVCGARSRAFDLASLPQGRGTGPGRAIPRLRLAVSIARMTFSPLPAHTVPKEFGMMAVNMAGFMPFPDSSKVVAIGAHRKLGHNAAADSVLAFSSII